MIKIGNIEANRFRIYKFNTHKAFTEAENTIYNDKKKNSNCLLAAISENTQIRSIDQKYLYYENGKENETYQIGTFENFIIRLAIEDNGYNADDCPLLDEVVFFEINHNEILKQIIDNGLYIGGKEYIFFAATTGQVRNNTITLLKRIFTKNINPS